MAENEYAKKLQELGFEQFDPEKEREGRGPATYRAELTDIKRDPEVTQPSYAKQVPVAKGQPVFIAFDADKINPKLSTTFAWDDTGQAWRKKGAVVDLAPYGFINPFKPVSIQ